jgi:cytochrome c peroxidase
MRSPLFSELKTLMPTTRTLAAQALTAISLLGGALVATAAITGCSGSGTSPQPVLSAEAALGQKIFNDPALSASGRQSCASCHDAAHGHAQPNDLPAQLGGPQLTLQGGRTSPSIRYLVSNTAFFFDAEGTPTGGFFWDGRATSLQDQARGPFLNPVEMANTSVADVVQRLSQASYASEFRTVYGDQVLSTPDAAFIHMTEALARFEAEDSQFHAYTSKYDAYLRGTANLTPQEYRGLVLFKDENKGNCAACHPADKGKDGSHPLFTDFSYDNLGLPRNPALQHNADASFYDLGLCARSTGDLKNRPDLCGAFKVPSLRNVALRPALFHNGVFKSLTDAVTFYVQRDTAPQKWYPLKPDGSVNKFNDLPTAYQANVNTSEAPYNSKLGDSPALTDSEIQDVVAFLRTLTDGYTTTGTP